MSGIFGIVNLEGKVDREDLEKMSARLSHRGQDAHDIWMSKDGRVGFGHRMRWTVPENLHEPLPFEDEEGYVITADSRLDNREELQELLGWQHLDLEKLGDSRLILGAYKKWGDASPEKLKGDFAYVIWDPSKEKLVAGKDYFGVKPLFFYQKENLFCFASEIKGLLELDYIPNTLNQTEVDNYLNNLHYSGVPLETTFYEDIYRILPAHSYHFSRQEKTKDYYGQRLWDSIEINVDQEDLPGEFRRVFQESIDHRIRCIGRVGSQLSGGLDSSSVSLLAAESLKKEGKTLYTAYANSNVASSDESNYVQDVLEASDNMEHSSINMLHPLESLEQLSGVFDEPLRMPCSSVFHASLKGLASKNAKVVLTGHDGDTIVGFGLEYIDGLIKCNEFEELITEIKAYSQNFRNMEDSRYQYPDLFNEDLVALLLLKKKIIPSIKDGKPLMAFNYIINTRKMNLNGMNWLKAFIKAMKMYIIKIPIYTLSKSSIFLDHNSAFKLNYSLDHPMIIANEEIDYMSQFLNIEMAHPFLNLELKKLACNYNSRLNFMNGYGRGLLRLAMKENLPNSLYKRNNKADFTGFILETFSDILNKLNNHHSGPKGRVILIEKSRLIEIKKEIKKNYFSIWTDRIWKKRRKDQKIITQNLKLGK